MAHGRSSRLTRLLGLALARRALRRSLALHGTRAGAVLAEVVADQAADLSR